MPRAYVELTAVWGNDDAESSIKVSRRMWSKIHAGDEYKKSAWSFYEAKRYRVMWRFKSKIVFIDNVDGQLFDGSISELIIQEA